MSKARFTVIGTFDMASKVQKATVEIDRDRNLVTVRPLRKRRVYGPVPLDTLAELLVRKQIAREVAERKAAKRAARKGR